jgi:ornithine cyclodeaminase/alanine dehydrogenase-like protein (mu-crystallin family)
MQIFTNQEVAARLDLESLSSALREAFQNQRHAYTMPPRMVLQQQEYIFLIMPCAWNHFLGTKIVTMKGKPGRGASVVKAEYTLYDAYSGKAILFTEADTLTDLRTAATSLLATRSFAREDAQVLGIFGTGRQAAAHLPVLMHARKFREVLVCGSSPEKSRAFCKAFSGIASLRAVDAQTCAAESHVLCTCTTSTTPLFDGHLLQPGTHLNLVGGFRPDSREVDDETIRRARVVVDTYEGCGEEAGDIVLPQKNGSVESGHVLADLHEALAGKKSIRTSPRDITLFKSVGCALEDMVAAHLLSQGLTTI